MVWSPCNRYFAISPTDPVRVVILDSTTLHRLRDLEFSPKTTSGPLALIFSPDSHTLTCSGTGLHSDEKLFVVSWDLRTGRAISAIERRGPMSRFNGRPLITYSMDGRNVGVLYRYHTFAVISLYDVVSGSHLYDRDVPHPRLHMDPSSSRSLLFYGIWTHGRSLRFATAEPNTITIWETGFGPKSALTQVETFPVPANVPHTEVFRRVLPEALAQFLPALHRLALIHTIRPEFQIVVWDHQDAKPPFIETNSRFRSPITLSSDGCFLACSTAGPEVYLWRETTVGYVLTAKLPSDSQNPSALLSPNGESIAVYDDSTIRLWHTKDLTTTTNSNNSNNNNSAPVASTVSTSSSIPTRSQKTENFVLEFHPVRQLAAIARRKDSTVTILDLKSGLPQLTIDTGVKVHGLGVVENAIVVVGSGEVVTWDLPEASCLNARMGTQDRAHTAYLSDDWQTDSVIAASISHDLLCVALVTQDVVKGGRRLYAYNASTGQRVGHAATGGNTPRFERNASGHVLWCAVGNEAELWPVGDDSLFCETTIDSVDDIGRLNSPFPWESPDGYQARKDGWILGPDGERLLMLPPRWRSDAVRRVWRGQYLALLPDILSEPVILELEPRSVSFQSR